jgi:hypothetical protein
MENNITDIHCHIDPLCIGLWLCCCHIVAPLCTFSWLRLDSVMDIWIHVVFLVAISLVNIVMDPQCIGRRPCFKSILYRAWVCLPQDDSYICCLMFVCNFHMTLLFQHPLVHIIL